MRKTYSVCYLEHAPENEKDWLAVPAARGFCELNFGSYLTPFADSFQLCRTESFWYFRAEGELPDQPFFADSYRIYSKDESMELFLRFPDDSIYQYIVNPAGGIGYFINGSYIPDHAATLQGMVENHRFRLVLKFPFPESRKEECQLRVWRNSNHLPGGPGILVWEGDNYKTAWHNLRICGKTAIAAGEKELNAEWNAFHAEFSSQPVVKAISTVFSLNGFHDSITLIRKLQERLRGGLAAVNQVDFDLPVGRFRALNGINLGPSMHHGKLYNLTEDFREMRIPYTRLHDAPLQNPGWRLVDVQQIFGRFDADPNDPENYYFEQTDEYIRNIIESGSRIVYRLGSSIEWSRKLHFARKPQDFRQFAEICAGIIRHYNCGWGNGFHYDIHYWEIWNEPEHPCMWDGSDEEYFQMYQTVACRLKQEFPRIAIGGPAATNISSPILKEFIHYCAKEKLPLDFFSYHAYPFDCQSVLESVGIVRIILWTAGFRSTEIHLNEWHYMPEGLSSAKLASPDAQKHFWEAPDGMNGIDSAAFMVSFLILSQDSELALSNFYGFDLGPAYGILSVYKKPYPTFYLLKAIGELFREYPIRVMAERIAEHLVFAGGQSEDGKKRTLLVSSFKGEEREIRIQMKGWQAPRVQIQTLTPDGFQPCGDAERNADGFILRKAPGSAVFRITEEE